MLDVKFIRENSAAVKQNLKNRGVGPETVDQLLKLDQEYRQLLKQTEELQAKRNQLSKVKPTPEQIKESKTVGEKLERIKDQGSRIKADLDKILLSLPNLSQPEVKVGKDESENQVVKTVGSLPNFSFPAKDYLELAKIHDLIDTERAAKVSGSRFGYLKNEAVLLWLALVNYVTDIILKEKFTPFISPVLVKKEVMENSGYNSYTEGAEAYFLEKDNLYLVGTGEHALLPYHADETLEADQLPLYYSTYSTCFRREAGSYGKDTKGIIRVHQFDKLEMVVITTPEKSREEFDHLLAIQEKIAQGLELPYHLLEVCTGDLPKPSSKVIDLECWLPSENRYRETHSASNCTAYQARRNNIRFKDKNGKVNFVHILNATALTPRLLVVLLENYQAKDGSITVPKALRKYLDFKKIA